MYLVGISSAVCLPLPFCAGCSFFVLLLMGAPILFCLGVPPVIWLLLSDGVPNLVYGQKMFAACDSFDLMAVPFFMLAGEIMERAEITTRLVEFANSIIGWVKGGLGCTVELAGIFLAGLSGSSNADTAALGAIMVGPLRKAGYDGYLVGEVFKADAEMSYADYYKKVAGEIAEICTY